MTAETEPRVKQGHTYVQWIVASLAAMTLLTYGLQAGWMMPTSKILQSKDSPTGYPLSDYEISWIASVQSIAAMFSVTSFSFTVDKCGRKIGVILIALLQSLCWAIKLFSANTSTLIIGRICCGLAAGGAYNIVPMYIREISQDSIRGILGCIITLSQTMGIFFIYLLGAYLGYFTVLWIVIWLPIATALLMIKAPESPAYLVKRGKIGEAAATLSLLRGFDVDNKSLQKELDAMKNEEERFRSLPKISFINILKNKSWRRGFILILILVTLQMNNGNFAILTYAGFIFASSGVTFRPELQTLTIPIVMICSSFVSMSCVEKIGRRSLLIIVCCLATLSLSSLATTILLQQRGIAVPGWVAVVSTLMYEAAYAGGILSMPYVIMAERSLPKFAQIRATVMGYLVTHGWFISFVHLFTFTPMANALGLYSIFYYYAIQNLVGIIIRATVMGYLVTHGWFISFVHLFTFTPMANALGLYSIFYYYAIQNLVGIIVCILFLPETKGKTVEQIEKDLGK